MASGAMGSIGESNEISMLSPSSCSDLMGVNRGSSSAALAAQRTMAAPSGSFASITPIQPCRRLRTCKVTKTPQRCAKTPSRGNTSGSLCWETAATTAVRASCRAAHRSASERDGILGLLAGFEHAESAALLDAVIYMAPEAPEILGSGHERADNNEPEQDSRHGLEPQVPPPDDEYRHGAHLQNHLRLSQGGCFDRESFGRGDIPQTEHREFPADNDHHHPSFNEIHAHQRNECRGNQELVSDGIEKDTQGGYLQAPPSQVSIRPIGRCSQEQDQHTPNLEVHGETPELEVGTAREQDHDEHGNKKDPQQRQ